MGRNSQRRRDEKRKRRAQQSARRDTGRDPRYSTSVLVQAGAHALAAGDTASAATIAAELAGRPDAARVARAEAAVMVSEIAEEGWDQALLCNLVRRSLSTRHARLVGVDVLGDDDVWPVVEILGLARTLPALPKLDDSAGHGPGIEDKVLAKVRALLAKAESTTFPEEAEALSAKAQELMTRHAIDHAVVSRGATGERPGGRRLVIDDPYAEAKSYLLGQVATANRCRAVYSSRLGFSTLFGFPADLVAVELLYTSLLVQGTRAMASAGRHDPGSRQPRFRRSFLLAYAGRIGERLVAVTAAQVDEADAVEGGWLLPVLAARDDAVEDAVAAVFPELVSRSMPIRDARGWAAGRAAADLADLAVGPAVRAG